MFLLYLLSVLSFGSIRSVNVKGKGGARAFVRVYKGSGEVFTFHELWLPESSLELNY